jgi:hypothetical protein
VLPKRPTADEERGQTPDLVSDKSVPNHSARIPWVFKTIFKVYLMFLLDIVPFLKIC